VTAARAISCEHEYGPSFHLSAKDLRSLDAMLAEDQFKNPQEGSEIVGWYRTTSRELSLTSEDTELASRSFREARSVMLLLQRGRNKAPRFLLLGRSADDEQPETIRAFSLEDVQAEIHPSPVAEEPELNSSESLANLTAATPPEPIVKSDSDQIEREAMPNGADAHRSNGAAHENGLSGAIRGLAFREAPFSSAQDPTKFFASPGHREALATIEYGVNSRKGLVILVGESGVGKTLLLHCLADRLKNNGTEFARVFNSRVSPQELIETLAYDLRLATGGTRVTTLFELHERAVASAERGKTVAILIDDAHRMDEAVLEEIEALCNIESRRGKLLQMVMAGRPELENKLDLPNLRGLRQRIALRATIGAFTAEESAGYVETRLKMAGAPPFQVMSPEIMEQIHLAAAGVPRVINAICTLVLENAVSSQLAVSFPMLENAIQQLGLQAESGYAHRAARIG
jgi:general secretion pathway protein A